MTMPDKQEPNCICRAAGNGIGSVCPIHNNSSSFEYVPAMPTQSDDWLRKTLLSVRDYGHSLAKQQFDDDPLDGVSPAEAEAAIQAQLDAAYQRGRIDEAKTCEEAKRHG